MYRLKLICVLTCALTCTAAVGGAQAAQRVPKVSKVSPLELLVGETLTISGKNFLPGRFKNTVIFQRTGSRPVFVKADEATKTQIEVVVPAKLMPFMSHRDGAPAPTTFRIGVLAKRFGKVFTPAKESPQIGPPKSGTAVPSSAPGAQAPGTPGAGAGSAAGTEGGPAAGSCDPAALPPGGDADVDLISTARELEIKTDPCLADTDGDSMEDGWEYESALDFNSRALPSPNKRSYSNPLDGSDADADHDGDGLSSIEEYSMWARYGGHQLPLNYSDGTQQSGGRVSVPAGSGIYDWDGDLALSNQERELDGELTDDARDVDGDGLGNWSELRGAFHSSKSANQPGGPYPVDYLDPDTDGDTLNDAADDQDHDGLSNLEEISRGQDGIFSNAQDPCAPVRSAYCPQH